MLRDKWRGLTIEELLNEEPEFEPVSSAEAVATSLIFLFMVAIAITAIFGMDSVVSKFQQRQQTNEECRDLRSKNQQQTEGSEEPVVKPKKRFSWDL